MKYCGRSAMASTERSATDFGRGANHCVLIGFMGSGKSTLALRLSLKTKLPLFSTDLHIAHRSGLSVAEIFERFGEAYFRCKEDEIFAELKGLERRHIVDCGGGFGAHQRVRDLGRVVFLDLGFEEIVERMREEERAKRPLFGDLQGARELFAQRRELYLRAASLRLRSEAEISDFLESFW